MLGTRAPRRGRKRLNVLYGTQYTTRPPRFRIVVNDRTLVTRDFAYYVENQLRRRFDLEGCPVIIDFQEPLVKIVGARRVAAGGRRSPG